MKTTLIFQYFLFVLLPLLTYSQDKININVYTYTNDYINEEYSFENAIADVKKLDEEFIVISKVRTSENGKKIKYGQFSWAFTYKDTLYINYSAFANTGERSKKFIKINKVSENFDAVFPKTNSKLFKISKMPTPYYGGGLVGVLISKAEGGDSEYYWEGREGGAYTIYILNKSKLRENHLEPRSKSELKVFSRKNLNQILDQMNQEQKSKKQIKEIMYEDVVEVITEYFQNKI